MDTPVAAPHLLKATIQKTLDSRTTHRGEIVLPCVPAALEYFLENVGIFFRDLGKPLSHSELSELRVLLAKTLGDGFRASGNNQLVISYETTTTPFLTKNLKCSVAIRENAVAGKYENWQQARENGSLFGTHPDARVISLVEKLFDPRKSPILDIGAGNGRNAVPLARRGHPVDALEVTPQFVEQLQEAATAGTLPLRVIARDFFASSNEIPKDHYQVILLSEVVSHFRGWDELRQLMTCANQCLRTGGLLVFNIFLSDESYVPDDLARQMAEVAWSSFFTRDELSRSMAGLPLEIIADDSAAQFERQHLPAEAWPPTPWFEPWASGRSAFPLPHGRPPMELRWIVIRKRDEVLEKGTV